MKIGGTHEGLKSTAVYEGIGIFRLLWEEPRRASPPTATPTPVLQADTRVCTSIHYTRDYVTTAGLFTVTFTIGPQFLVGLFPSHSEI